MIELEKQLNSCPICGGQPILRSHVQWGDGSYDIEIGCINCGLTLDYYCSGNYSEVKWRYSGMVRNSLVDTWNKGLEL